MNVSPKAIPLQVDLSPLKTALARRRAEFGQRGVYLGNVDLPLGISRRVHDRDAGTEAQLDGLPGERIRP